MKPQLRYCCIHYYIIPPALQIRVKMRKEHTMYAYEQCHSCTTSLNEVIAHVFAMYRNSALLHVA